MWSPVRHFCRGCTVEARGKTTKQCCYTAESSITHSVEAIRSEGLVRRSDIARVHHKSLSGLEGEPEVVLPGVTE